VRASPHQGDDAPAAPSPPRPGEDRFVLRRRQRAAIEVEGGVRWGRLTPATLDGAHIIELVYAARAESHSQAHRHPEGVGARIYAGRPA
jgi:hypothetical protein